MRIPKQCTLNKKQNTALYYYGTEDLTIVLKGTNSLKLSRETETDRCVMLFQGNRNASPTVTIAGEENGSLTVDGGNVDLKSYGIYAEYTSVTIAKAQVTAKGSNGYVLLHAW